MDQEDVAGIDLRLDRARRVLAVVAHPDDESFGLGAVLTALAQGGAETSVLCFTHGEASTLHAGEGALAMVRANEFEAAATVLGVERAELLAYPDGALVDTPLHELVRHVARVVDGVGADLLLVFDEGGITGHPDHRRATEAALAGATGAGLPVVAWALPETVASVLNAEFATTFAGRAAADLGRALTVDRERQRLAIALHRSQSTDNPVLWRRLELLGDVEWLRPLRPGGRAGEAG